MRFDIEHLESYDDEALLDELRRVAKIVGNSKLTLKQFTAHANVHGSTLQKRFGGWRNALAAAGLDDRIDKSGLKKSKEEIIDAIKVAASKQGENPLTLKEFERISGITGGPVRRIFGSWSKALKAAGLEQSPLGKRYTDEECFENMLAVWTHYGRPPQHDEMNKSPSVVGSKAYVLRWGTWRKALEAFVQRVNSNRSAVPAGTGEQFTEQTHQKVDKRGARDIPLSLRYKVLVRDHFRCAICGRSPAKDIGVTLHVDHIHPWSKGGPTEIENLRVLCSDCNLGKGDKIEKEI